MRYRQIYRLAAFAYTNGRGLWSCRPGRRVELTKMDISYLDWDSEAVGKDRIYPYFGHIRVFFKTKSWNTGREGLIYTDPGFLRDLKRILRDRGFDVRDLGYSEEGAQGRTYVDLDVGRKFLKSWANRS